MVTPVSQSKKMVRRKSITGGGVETVGMEGASKDSPKAPTAQVGMLEARQKAFYLKVANYKSEINQKLPTAYSQLVNDFKEWMEQRPQKLKDMVMAKNKSNKMKEVVVDRVKGLKEAAECLSKVLESNPEGRKEIHERLLNQITKAGKVEKGKITKHGFLELATFFSGTEVKDPRKVTQP